MSNPNLLPPWKPGECGNPRKIYRRRPKPHAPDPIATAIMEAFHGGGWHRWEDLTVKGHWAEKFGAIQLLRAREALTALGVLVSAQVSAHDGSPAGVAWRVIVPGRGEPPKQHGPNGPAIWHEGMGSWVYMVPRQQQEAQGQEAQQDVTQLSGASVGES
jgi:hypothetical protein